MTIVAIRYGSAHGTAWVFLEKDSCQLSNWQMAIFKNRHAAEEFVAQHQKCCFMDYPPHTLEYVGIDIPAVGGALSARSHGGR